MTTYALRFRAPGRRIDDDLATRFYDAFEGALTEACGSLVVTVYVESDDVVAAAQQAVGDVEQVLGIDVEAIDLDLVGVADIARRTGRTRQSVQQLVDGSRGGGDFPPAIGAPGGSRVWSWASVDAWLRKRGDDVDDEVPIPADQAAIVAGWLAARNCRRLSDLSERRVFETTVTRADGVDLTSEAMRDAVATYSAWRVQAEIRVMAWQ